jgi:hypothetical protein
MRLATGPGIHSEMDETKMAPFRIHACCEIRRIGHLRGFFITIFQSNLSKR